MNAPEEFIVPPMSARAFLVKHKQSITIIDIKGHQPGDLVAFQNGDLSVHFSQARTRVENRATAVTAGDNLWTNTFPPQIMFTIEKDSFGFHDLLYPPCCRYALEKRFGVLRNGCLENLAKALKKWKIKPHEIPDPLNLFFCVSVDRKNKMKILEPSSPAGSFIQLRAEMDCIVAISTCAVPFPQRTPSPYKVLIS